MESWKRISLQSRMLVALVPTIGMLVFSSYMTWKRGTVKDPEVELGTHMERVLAQQELQVVKMSEGLLGYVSDPKNIEFKKNKDAADEAYASYAKEMDELVGQFPEIAAQNRKMADFDAQTLDRLEDEMMERIERGDGALKYFYESYLPARKKQAEEFAAFAKLVRAKESELTSRIEGRKREDAAMAIALLWASFVIGLGLVFWILASNLSKANSLFRKTEDISRELARSADRLNDSATDLSSSTQEEAAALQETVASIDELTAMIRKNADNAEESRKVSERTRQSADEGRQAMQRMIDAIRSISASNQQVQVQVEAGNEEIRSIIALFEDIAAKTQVINDIVFQTRLLSFNASVEAARAGEHGKGFAVVAEEVGKLAEMSGNAAKEISGKLDESGKKVQTIIESTGSRVADILKSGAEIVTEGTGIAEQCSKILADLIRDVGAVDARVAEISVASNEQAKGVEEISRAASQLDQTTQKNSSIANSANESSNELAQKAKDLEYIVETLTALFRGETEPGVNAVERSFSSPTVSGEDDRVVPIHKNAA